MVRYKIVRRLFLLLILVGVLTISLMGTESGVVAENNSEGELPPPDNSNYTVEHITLEDGTALYNGTPPRVLVVDPNPEMQNLRFPQAPWIEDAISDRSTRTATFDITYKAAGTSDLWETPCSTFPERAKAAFSAAAAIWANSIQSSVPITISACWSNDLPIGVLGYSGCELIHRNFPGAPKSNTWYMPSLANSFAGTDLNAAYADMYITYSSAFDWYYGTDGKTPSGFYDLVTVAAHEIAHGLNFSGIMVYSGVRAEYGSSGDPSIFETFMESGGGIKLTSYTNPSTALATLVTSNNLWWDGVSSNAANGGVRVKMFAPLTWIPGSSYSHLDYETFAGTINSMMVYMIASGSSQHNPGPVTAGMLKDMGWVINSALVEKPDAPNEVSASDGVFSDKVLLTWNSPLFGVSNFEVYRNTTDSNSGEELLSDTVTSNFYYDFSAIQDTPYYYWVKACNSFGCSDYSSSDSGIADSEAITNSIFLPLIHK